MRRLLSALIDHDSTFCDNESGGGEGRAKGEGRFERHLEERGIRTSRPT